MNKYIAYVRMASIALASASGALVYIQANFGTFLQAYPEAVKALAVTSAIVYGLSSMVNHLQDANQTPANNPSPTTATTTEK